MKKLLWILLFISGIASAQEIDSMAVDSLVVAIDTAEVEPPPYFLGAYVEGGVSYEAVIPGRNLLTFLGFGVQYNRWQLSFNRYDFEGEVQSFVVFPNVFELNYRYGGFNAGYAFLKSEWLDAIINAGYFRGDMTWRNMEDGQDFLRDEFGLMKASLKLEMGKFRYVKPYASIGYQQMNDLKLSQVDGDDFSGLFLTAGIRIGYFNQ